MEAVIKMLEDKLRADMRAYNLYKPQQEIMLPTFEVWAGYSRREIESCVALLKVIKSDTFLFSGIITPIVNELRSAKKSTQNSQLIYLNKYVFCKRRQGKSLKLQTILHLIAERSVLLRKSWMN